MEFRIVRTRNIGHNFFGLCCRPLTHLKANMTQYHFILRIISYFCDWDWSQQFHWVVQPDWIFLHWKKLWMIVLSLQTISLLVFMSGALGKKGPFLVLSPLSVMENWRKELEWYSHTHIRIYIHSLQSTHNNSVCYRPQVPGLKHVCLSWLQLRSFFDCAVLLWRQRETGWASEGIRHTGLSCPSHNVWGLWWFCESKMTQSFIYV